jgi:hypothetical protein
MQYNRREGGGDNEELAEEQPQGASMAARFRNPSKEGCPGTFSQSIIAISSRETLRGLSVCVLRMRFFERGG